MSEPIPPTNLTEKFAALSQQLATQHGVVLDAIAQLRGVGPENTLKSVNQSIWSLAGPAPGVNLTGLKAAIDALGGGKSLSSLFGLWDPGAGITPYNLLDAIYIAITASGGTNEQANAILARLIAQFDTSVVYPTMKDLLITISAQQAALVANTANPTNVVPVGICESPFVSVGAAVWPVTPMTTTPVTVAYWDFSNSTEFEEGEVLGASGTVLIKTVSEPIDWSGYRFYVASSASTFSAAFLDPTRYPTNEWVTLPNLGSLFISVDGSGIDLVVYICGTDAPVLGGCPAAAMSPLSPGGWRIPVAGDEYWEMASGYDNGGETWAMNINVPDVVAAGSGLTSTRPAFIITTGDTAELCIAWSGGRAGESLKLTEYRYAAGAWTRHTGSWILMDGADALSGSRRITVQSGAEYAYTVMAVYMPGEFNATPPSATVTLSWLPPGWDAT